MALKTAAEKAAALATTEQPKTVQTTILELAMYKQYTWGGITYEAGKPYRFRSEDAMILLAETDADRPVWKIYSPPKIQQAPKNEVVDATLKRAVATPVDEIGLPAKRIDVGSDSEIADILEQTTALDQQGDVTV